MRERNRLLSVFLCVTLLFLSIFTGKVSASVKSGRITGDGVNMRSAPNSADSQVIATFSLGTVVQINETVNGNEAVSGYGNTWYLVTAEGKTGYIYGKYVEIINAPVYDENFEKNLLNFPESYRQPLREIHAEYPNWVFVADKVSIGLDAAINLEYGGENVLATRKLVELTYGIEWYDSRVDTSNPKYIAESRWTYPSRETIAFFMDPRNALTLSGKKGSFPNIFTFMQQSYSADIQTVEGLRSIIKGTFLEKGYGGNSDAYVSDIMSAAGKSGVSPYIIASTIITEQGTKGTSSLISGTYAEYEGYYNFFNYGASGDNVIKNGLEYAKSNGWNSRAASITGGAVKYGSGYISKGQDTYYYMDFNVKNPSNIGHQYATSVYDQCVKATNAKKAYVDNKEGALTFKIPVYSSMPEKVYDAPSIENMPNTGDQEQPGQGGTTAGKKGDISGDGIVNGKDMAILKSYLLGLRTLTSEEKNYADVSGDKEVNGKDLAIIKMYLLGNRTL